MRRMLFRLHTLFFLSSLILTNIARSESAIAPSQSTTQLTDDDRRILENGRIGGARRTFGAILAFYPGFGIGHAVEGRYLHRGWIFTLSEAGSLAIASSGVESCASIEGDCGAVVIGILGFLGFKVWEFVDGIVGPIRDNRQYLKLQTRPQVSIEPGIMVMPLPLARRDDHGQHSAHAGIGLNWTFH